MRSRGTRPLRDWRSGSTPLGVHDPDGLCHRVEHGGEEILRADLPATEISQGGQSRVCMKPDPRADRRQASDPAGDAASAVLAAGVSVKAEETKIKP